MASVIPPVTGLTIEYTSSVSGSGKTRRAISLALKAAWDRDERFIFAMPTIKLIGEAAEFARRQTQTKVPIVVITSKNEDSSSNQPPSSTQSTSDRLIRLLKRNKPGGILIFITHETLFRVARDWPAEAAQYHLVIDEVPEVILARTPFWLHDNRYVLTSFLELGELVTDSPGLRHRRNRARATSPVLGVMPLAQREMNLVDALIKQIDDGGFAPMPRRKLNQLRTFEQYIANGLDPAAPGEFEQAQARIVPLRAEFRAAFEIPVNDEDDPANGGHCYCILRAHSIGRVQRRVHLRQFDNVYEMIAPVPQWVAQDTQLFAEEKAWLDMADPNPQDRNPRRGKVSICGFRRPDELRHFAKVTLLGALVEFSLAWQVWEALGVNFVESQWVKLAQKTTWLGSRRLRIFWITEDGWSKWRRNKSGGVAAIFEAIRKAGVIDQDEKLVVQTNRDDATEFNPELVRRYFPKAEVLPHRVEGLNEYRGVHLLVHTATLNAYGPDIAFLEWILGVDSKAQRLDRTGRSVYQCAMRTSLRDVNSEHSVTVVLMDRDVAEFVAQYFSPAGNVEVRPLDGVEGVIAPKAKMGRPKKPGALTNAEHQRRWRERHKGA
jgi:hypothetical protein